MIKGVYILNHRTLVKVTATENCLAFRTISRCGKSPCSLYIVKQELLDGLNEFPRTSVTVNDGSSFAKLWRGLKKNTVKIHFTWLRGSSDHLTGWEETLTLPYDGLMAIAKAQEGSQWNVLSLEDPGLPKLTFCERENLHAAVNDPVVRRKLSRFLRDNFNWRDSDEIRLFNDFLPYSFFFREMRHGQPGICGGVIFHGQEDMKKAQYSIHT